MHLPDCLEALGDVIGYRYLHAEATYPPDDPYPSKSRFGDGSLWTLYLAETPTGAVAEFLRRHPEFLMLQEDLRIRVYEISLTVTCEVLDLLAGACQRIAGVEQRDLVSSDPDEDTRYERCRDLAKKFSTRCCGFRYPSASLHSHRWNLVLFGLQDPDQWICSAVRLVGRPWVAPAEVRAIDVGGGS